MIRPERDKPRLKAHIQALRWLTRRDYSAVELSARLRTAGYADDEIQDALRWLSDGAWQSDARFAASLARRRSGSYGGRLIRAELEQHRIEGEDITEALDGLAATDAERAAAWVEKRSRGQALSHDNRVRWSRALIARGFSADDTRAALQTLSDRRAEPWEAPTYSRGGLSGSSFRRRGKTAAPGLADDAGDVADFAPDPFDPEG